MFKRTKAFCILLILLSVFVSPPFAGAQQDFWEMDTAREFEKKQEIYSNQGVTHSGQATGVVGGFFGGSLAEEPAHTYSGPMERLLGLAGDGQKKVPEHWEDFEQVEHSRAEEEYTSSHRWQMEEEIAKPFDKDAPFGDRFRDVEKRLNQMRSTHSEDKYFKKYSR